MANSFIEQTFPECDTFTGQKRKTCRGESSLPLNGRNSINAYRALWGLPPLEQLTQRATIPTGSAKTMTFMQRATSFVKTIGKTIANWKLSDQSVINERLAICRNCPSYINEGCKLCGCQVVAKQKLLNKLANPSAVCPAGKWGAR